MKVWLKPGGKQISIFCKGFCKGIIWDWKTKYLQTSLGNKWMEPAPKQGWVLRRVGGERSAVRIYPAPMITPILALQLVRSHLCIKTRAWSERCIIAATPYRRVLGLRWRRRVQLGLHPVLFTIKLIGGKLPLQKTSLTLPQRHPFDSCRIWWAGGGGWGRPVWELRTKICVLNSRPSCVILDMTIDIFS